MKDETVRRYDLTDKVVKQITSYFELRAGINKLKKERKEATVKALEAGEEGEAVQSVREGFHSQIMPLVAQSNGLMKSIKHEILFLGNHKSKVDNTLPLEELR